MEEAIKNKQNIKLICQNLLKFIDDGTAYTEVQPKKTGNFIELGYVDYNITFRNLLGELNKTLGEDFNYKTNMKQQAIDKKDILTLNLQQIATYLTFIIRGERFMGGYIASCLENGTLKNLLLRTIELC